MYVFQFACSSFLSTDRTRHHDRCLERVAVATPIVPVDANSEGVVRAAQVQAVEVGVVAGVAVPPTPFVPVRGGSELFVFMVILRVGKLVLLLANEITKKKILQLEVHDNNNIHVVGGK